MTTNDEAENPTETKLQVAQAELADAKAAVKRLEDPHWATKYQALTEGRNIELSVYWTRYEVMAALHVGAAGALLATQPGLCLPSLVLSTIGGVGVMMSLAWLTFAVKGAAWVSAWNKTLQEVERGHALTAQATVLEKGRASIFPISITVAAVALTVVFLALWAVLAFEVRTNWIRTTMTCT